ncbi:hypothetical protein [Streptomyces sp. NPDC088726]|uniref:hypothetical protein n=1 Tax=Streptomyces sp. NPDC088726 TaxID=3365874 RepID=UPI00382B4470
MGERLTEVIAALAGHAVALDAPSSAPEFGNLPLIELLAPVTPSQVLLSVSEEHRAQRVIDALSSSGSCWVTPTTWNGRSAARISLSNWRGSEESAEATAAAFLEAYRDHPG